MMIINLYLYICRVFPAGSLIFKGVLLIYGNLGKVVKISIYQQKR